MRSRVGILATLIGLLLPLAACKKAVPEAPPPSAQSLPPLEVTAEGKWLYTYVDDKGVFVTVDDASKIPAEARRLVRVIDPAKAADHRADTVAVYVVDLDEVKRLGKAPARVLSREAFETGALAQLPPGESSAYPGPAGEAAVDPAAAPAAGVPAPGPAGAPVVTLYGTSWCGACKSAREYLRARRIPFADRDIEKDQAASRELRDKARRLGVSADRIPVLEVRGRLLIGFDRARLEALLGEAT